MPSYDTFVIGASAGGVEALIRLVGQLPAKLPAAIFVVVHFPPTAHSALPQILSRKGELPAFHPQDGEAIEPGRIYVAPPDRHMLINGSFIHLSAGPRENSVRPAIDPLFRSAARSRGSRAVGIVLSGTLGDGSGGLQAIKSEGGLAFVQDPHEALYSGMPLNAIQQAQVDAVLKVDDLAQTIVSLSSSPVIEGGTTVPSREVDPNRIIQKDFQEFEIGKDKNGHSVLTCPDCGGVIWEMHEGEVVSFRCHVGHAYSVDSFLFEQGSRLEGALWTAVRALEERASLLRRLSAMSANRSASLLEKRLAQQAEEVEQSADVIRRLLESGAPGTYLAPKSNDRPRHAGPPPA
jgi:two-component system, chemotaxis family, protein-glutamate methylesterase/glutaminase